MCACMVAYYSAAQFQGHWNWQLRTLQILMEFLLSATLASTPWMESDLKSFDLNTGELYISSLLDCMSITYSPAENA